MLACFFHRLIYLFQNLEGKELSSLCLEGDFGLTKVRQKMFCAGLFLIDDTVKLMAAFCRKIRKLKPYSEYFPGWELQLQTILLKLSLH